jgi:23S rRNA pseudouridine1911/1915/1917 synthase
VSQPSATAAQTPRILLLDSHLLVIDKPAGMLSQSDITGDLCALNWGKAMLKERFDKPGNVFLGLVQRLDRPTSGAMVFARTSKAAARLSAAIRERRVEKVYLALCSARPAVDEGLLEDWLLPGRDGADTRRCAANTPGAQQAALRWRVVAQGDEGVLCEVALLTGRKHQIRAQFAAQGAAIVGDGRYGGRGPFPAGAIALHAHRLAFPHPIGGERVEVEVPLPSTFPLWARR